MYRLSKIVFHRLSFPSSSAVVFFCVVLRGFLPVVFLPACESLKICVELGRISGCEDLAERMYIIDHGLGQAMAVMEHQSDDLAFVRMFVDVGDRARVGRLCSCCEGFRRTRLCASALRRSTSSLREYNPSLLQVSVVRMSKVRVVQFGVE